jgi:hypothetical protein
MPPRKPSLPLQIPPSNHQHGLTVHVLYMYFYNYLFAHLFLIIPLLIPLFIYIFMLLKGMETW